MSIYEAAELLQRELRERQTPWLTAVGVGERNGRPCIILYVRRAGASDINLLKRGWKGFPVVIKKSGSPRLLAARICSL
jgi:hypothetical protein